MAGLLSSAAAAAAEAAADRPERLVDRVFIVSDCSSSS